MTDLDRGRELIEKYLDEVIDKVELAELELLIVSDPEVAKEFARCARTDGYVYFHFNQAAAQNAVQLEQKSALEKKAASRLFVRDVDYLHPRPVTRSWVERLLVPTGSILIHAAIILLLVYLVSYEPPEQRYESATVTMVTRETQTFEPKPSLPPDESQEPVFTPGAEPGFAESSVGSAEAPSPGSDEGEGVGTGTGPDEGETAGALEIPGDVQGSLIFKGAVNSRSAGGRQAALGRYSGAMGTQTEASVVRALDWLKTNQQADGSWGPNKVALTGLSLLTFLAHGEMTSSEDYGKTVESAIRFLLSKQREDGTFADVSTQAGPYEHGIATYAMCEAYGLTRVPVLKPVMEKAVQVILNGQQKGGGWDYKYGKGGRRDTSIAGWQIQALKAAHIAGAENSGIEEALAKAADDLKRARDPVTGKFHYSDPKSQTSESITGVAVLCLELIGQGDSKEARQGLSALTKALCKWESAPEWAMYGWYYITQAKFHDGGSEWKGWNNQFARAFTKSQNKDGSWTAPREDEQKYGPAYSTTLAALTLQVYYRFLPTYQTAAINKEVAATADSDVTIALQ